MENLSKIFKKNKQSIINCIENKSTKIALEKLDAFEKELERYISRKEKENNCQNEGDEIYKDIFESIADVFFRLDANGFIKVISPSVYNVLGYKTEEVIGRSFVEFFKYPEKAYELIERILNGEIINQYESIMLNKNDDEIIMSTRIKIFHDSSGKLTCIEGITRNITEQKKAESALQQSEEKFRKLTELSPAAICIQTNDKFLWTNPAWTILSGYSFDEALKMGPWDIIHPDMKEQTKKYSENRLSGKNAPFRYEIKVLSKDKKVKWMDIVLSVIDYEGEIASLAVSTDITKRKIMEEALVKSEGELQTLNAQKDKFFSIISHDLRSPIGSSVQLSKMLKDEYKSMSKDTIELFINNLYKVSNNTYKLLENLLIWSTSSLGRYNIKYELVNVKTVINGTVKLNLESANLKDIIINTDIQKELFVFADMSSVLTILRNLISNAIKFTKRGGSITINAVERKRNSKNRHIEISVKDTGIGVPKEILDKLFKIDESFTTLGTEKERGTGLGLVLCKELIDKNNGEIWAESEIGNGSTFYFTLSCEPII
jgi:PAS domain S-box-containing protein